MDSFGFLGIFALVGVALGMGRALASLFESLSRNPEAFDKIKVFAFLGIGSLDLLGLLAFIIAYLK